jgi:hypothetical protein
LNTNDLQRAKRLAADFFPTGFQQLGSCPANGKRREEEQRNVAKDTGKVAESQRRRRD